MSIKWSQSRVHLEHILLENNLLISVCFCLSIRLKAVLSCHFGTHPCQVLHLDETESVSFVLYLSEKMIHFRNKVVAEIVTSEENYVHNLRVLVGVCFHFYPSDETKQHNSLC
jgi:hypothetical protein